MRLNLGCGNKLLDGYVNVDLPDNHSGVAPDVACDLRKLPFPSNSVDEILSVHVIEHFYRWEVDDLLREWVRVLKVGGEMIIECPNLAEACKQFLKNPYITGFEKDASTSLWVLYGDPSWKDATMVHRWGYTPATLGYSMHFAGLEEVAQKPAQFKMREPRDMRLVGKKSPIYRTSRGDLNCGRY